MFMGLIMYEKFNIAKGLFYPEPLPRREGLGEVEERGFFSFYIALFTDIVFICIHYVNIINKLFC